MGFIQRQTGVVTYYLGVAAGLRNRFCEGGWLTCLTFGFAKLPFAKTAYGCVPFNVEIWGSVGKNGTRVVATRVGEMPALMYVLRSMWFGLSAPKEKLLLDPTAGLRCSRPLSS